MHKVEGIFLFHAISYFHFYLWAKFFDTFVLKKSGLRVKISSRFFGMTIPFERVERWIDVAPFPFLDQLTNGPICKRTNRWKGTWLKDIKNGQTLNKKDSIQKQTHETSGKTIKDMRV